MTDIYLTEQSITFDSEDATKIGSLKHGVVVSLFNRITEA